MTKQKKPLSGGAIANQKRKELRTNIALETLKNLSPSLKFKSRTAIYEHLADVINLYEKHNNSMTDKGPCTRSGLYGISNVKEAVEKYWVTGILVSDDVNLSQTIEAAAKKALMDKDIEISNLKYKLSEQERFLKESDDDVRNLTSFIQSKDFKSVRNTETSDSQKYLQTGSDASEKLVEQLCQVIFKLEVWADNLLERQHDGALIDIGQEHEVVSAKLMREYHNRVPISQLRNNSGKS